MKTIYLDSNFMCYTTNNGSRQAIKIDLFDNLCTSAIECYRYIPAGQVWIRPDGRITPGLFIQATKDVSEIQRQYDIDNSIYLNSLKIQQEENFIATRNYSVGSFIGIYGKLYEVISAIPMHSSIQDKQNVIETTIEHYLDTIKEE